MKSYVITIVLKRRRIKAMIKASNPGSAICNFIRQIGNPTETVLSVTCKVAL